MHEEAYNNNVTKIKHATKKLGDVNEKITKYDAELKMSRAEAEMAKLATSFNFDVTTDFGQIEEVIQDKIGLNRAKARVAADLSSEGLVDIQREQAMEKVMADQALRDFEVQMGLVTPETANVTEATKELGPAAKTKVDGRLSRCRESTSYAIRLAYSNSQLSIRLHGAIQRSHRRS